MAASKTTLTLEQAIERARRHIAAADKEYMLRILQAYRDAWEELQPQWEVLEAGLEAGKDKTWLLARLSAYQVQLEDRIRRFSYWLGPERERAIMDAIKQARHDTRDIVEKSYGWLGPNIIRTVWHEIPEETLRTMLAMTGPGSPLYGRMEERLGPEVAARVGRGLRTGIALGYHPRKLQAILLRELGAGLQWSLTSTRTAMMQAYWRTTSNIYKRNPVVNGWYWLAALDDRTCFLCAMQSGTWHKKTETLNGHYNCRCTMVPAVKSFKDLGMNIPGPPKPNIPNGRKWFEGLSAGRQKKMMGLTKWQMWKDGKIDLTDILTTRKDEVYGDMLAAKTIAQLTGEAPPEPAPSGVEPPWQEALRKEEAAIYKEPVEHACVISRDGLDIRRATGDEDSVRVPWTRSLGEGAISTHNHPGAFGTPLSQADVEVAIRFNFSRQRAVSINRLSEVMPGPDGWPTIEEFDKAFEEARHKWHGWAFGQYLHGKTRSPEWWDDWVGRYFDYNAAMVEACRKTGIIYRYVHWEPEI